MSAIAWLRNVRVEFGKSREKSIILDNVTLTVPEKSIIGLIGPSGCGKTTLLRTLIGLVSKKSGEIFVGGYRDDDIRDKLSPLYLGYMPQDVGLHFLWKGVDMLRFAGRVFNIKQSEIDERIKFLQDKIDLPRDLGYISSMSGGEKRRMSLALALIHRPKFLILDEPTVGSDPLSRIKIWRYLEECRDRYGMTIIITTHYVEEVNQADSIAFMYRGQVLCHEKPGRLLQIHGARDLEETTRTICIKYKQMKEEKCDTDLELSIDNYEKLSPVEPAGNVESISQARILWASVIRITMEWRFNLLSAVFFSFWFCFLIFVITVYLWRIPQEIPICILGSESGENSFSNVTQEFINELNSSVLLDLKYCSSSIEDIPKSAANNFISISNGFETDLYRRAFHLNYGGHISPLLQYYGQSSDVIRAQLIEYFLQNSAIKKILTMRNSMNVTRSAHLYEIIKIEPIDGKEIEDNDRRVNSHLVPMYYMVFTYIYGQAYGSVSLGFDRMDSLHDRQKIMGIKPGPLLLAHIFRANTQHILIFDIGGLILCVVCGFSLDSSVWKFMGASHFLSACGYCVGCFLGTQVSSIFAVLCILFLYNFSQIWFNSIIWPSLSIPYFMRPFLSIFPYKEMVESAQRVLVGLEGAGMDQFLVPCIWIIISLTLAWRSLR
ncbi:ABC transporter G family member 23-like [Brevipalpus obovatus]|uniref:ABC transporter G family member 23-like n=1 Tax=Brevipalpus obovatus TaxID=246614 RepID=UPI003D9E87C7